MASSSQTVTFGLHVTLDAGLRRMISHMCYALLPLLPSEVGEKEPPPPVCQWAQHGPLQYPVAHYHWLPQLVSLGLLQVLLQRAQRGFKSLRGAQPAGG